MHEVLVNRLVKLVQEKVWLDCLDMTIAVDWDVKPQTKQQLTYGFHSNIYSNQSDDFGLCDIKVLAHLNKFF